jgi:hypothetical protein
MRPTLILITLALLAFVVAALTGCATTEQERKTPEVEYSAK